MRTLPLTADVVIIGGGIIGVSIAYHLAKKGVRDVLLLERGMMGEGATGKCAGGIRTQFSTEINIRFSLLSREVIDSFRDEFGVDPEFHQVGYLFLAQTRQQWTILKANARLIRSMGLRLELLDPGDILHRWPFIRVDDLKGGSYTEGDGYAGPFEVLQGFAKGARRLGAVLKEGVEVSGIELEKGRIQAVKTARGLKVHTPVVVNAAGPRAAGVAAWLDVDLPVHPLRRQIFFTDLFEELPQAIPMTIDMEYGWYMRREGNGLLLSGPQDSESSFREGVDFEGREWAALRSMHRVPVLERAGIARGWAGLYSISPDHHAIMGTYPEIPGFFCANGFSGHGFQHSPAVGLLMAELIADGETRTLDINSLRPTRFREGDLIHEPLTAFRD